MARKSFSSVSALLFALSLTVGGSWAEAGDGLRGVFCNQNGYYGLSHGRQLGNGGLYGGPRIQNVPYENGDYSHAFVKPYYPYANISVIRTPTPPSPTETVPSRTNANK